MCTFTITWRTSHTSMRVPTIFAWLKSITGSFLTFYIKNLLFSRIRSHLNLIVSNWNISKQSKMIRYDVMWNKRQSEVKCMANRWWLLLFMNLPIWGMEIHATPFNNNNALYRSTPNFHSLLINVFLLHTYTTKHFIIRLNVFILLFIMKVLPPREKSFRMSSACVFQHFKMSHRHVTVSVSMTQ